MEDYKSRFIEYLLTTQALKGNGDFSLKSKRLSPWFVNIGDFNDGHSLRELGRFYAYSILGATANSKIDILYGIPEKGKKRAKKIDKRHQYDIIKTDSEASCPLGELGRV